MRAALRAAVKSINPTAPPPVIIDALRTVAKNHGLSAGQLPELIGKYLAHFEINMNGRPLAAILSTGYQIPAAENVGRTLDSLLNGIIGESLGQLGRSGRDDWARVWKHMGKEIRHVADKMHAKGLRLLFAYLLAQAVEVEWERIVRKARSAPQAGSVRPDRIQRFLKTAKKKLVLILGPDSGDNIQHLYKIRQSMEARGYQCQLIKDMNEHSEVGLIAKVLFVALAARFIIVENSAPSGHLYEFPFIRMAECVIAVMQREGVGATWMMEDMYTKHPLTKRFVYNQRTLERVVGTATAWAEKRIAKNMKANQDAWTWAAE